MKDEISHILDLPDMYVGSKRSKTIEDYCYVLQENTIPFRIVKKELNYAPAFLRIFVEILSNAIDNVQRSKEAGIECKNIKVSIDKETGKTSVWNDGVVIPVVYNEKYKMYNHTLVFGHLRASGNFSKDEEKLVSGRNGVGSTTVNVFSREFTVKGVDPVNGKMFVQTWTDNMRKSSKPKITSSKLKTGYTEITYYPDFSQFGVEKYTDDLLSIYYKYVVDTAMLTGVKVYLNGDLVKVPNLISYAQLYTNSDEKVDSMYIETSHSKVLVCPSQEGFQSISFVNGVHTRNGGNHVNAFTEALFRPIVKKINDKNKSKLTISDVKNYFRLFVVSTVVNPEFNSQEKDKLEHPKIEANIDSKFIDKLLKWDVVKEIEDYVKLKNSFSLKSLERKNKGYVKVDNLDNANLAGTSRSTECSLILTEGLSAATFGIIGCETGAYGTKGRDTYGFFTLRGKVLNLRSASADSILKNKIVMDLIQSLGLRQDVDYTLEENYKKLRYGRVIILCDSDVDGYAITGLLVNFFHFLFPSLLRRNQPYLVSMCTPIVRVRLSKNNDILFYDEMKFREFAKTKTPEWLKKNSQYYKGLGSADNKDAKELFGKKILEFEYDMDADTTLDKVFHKKNTDLRKEWLEQYDPSRKSFSIQDIDDTYIPMSITDFLENEVIQFSWASCKRAIPALIDGQKNGQRKILYGVKKAGLFYNKPPMKVAQFGAYVAKETSYHHGEQSLYETIIKMAQDFVGSNNIPLLDRKGNFGTLIHNGKDASQPRYIFTRMDKLTPLIFRKEDDPLLNYINEDGDDVEPSFYVPILPVVLVNGANGIGTGYSSSIPAYNPLDIIAIIRTYLREGVLGDVNLLPWYRGFRGTIEKENSNKYISYGIMNKIKKNIIEITEIPIGKSIDEYKCFLEDLLQKKVIQSFTNNSKPNRAYFTVKTERNLDMKSLGLYSYIHTSNMVLFDNSEKLKKYTINEIIYDFCKIRYDYYKLRKEYQIKLLEKEVKSLRNKIRFIEHTITGKININQDEDLLVDILKRNNFDTEADSFDYLLNMPMRYLTTTTISKLKSDLTSKENYLEDFRNLSEKQIWLNELAEFEASYKKWISENEI